MKLLHIKLIIGIILVFELIFIFSFFIVKPTPQSNENLGFILLTPNESDQIREIRNSGYKGLIVIPESMEIYGQSTDLDKYADELQSIAYSWFD